MIIIMKPNSSEEAIRKAALLVEKSDLQTHISKGSEVTIVGVVGDKSKLSSANLGIADGVDNFDQFYQLTNELRPYAQLSGRSF